MTHLTTMTASRALGRIADWQTALRAENKSPGTIFIYTDGATRYLRWCADGNLLPMSRAVLNSWIAGLLDGGSSPGTARIRQLAVRRFASWLTAGGEVARRRPVPRHQDTALRTAAGRTADRRRVSARSSPPVPSRTSMRGLRAR